MPSPTGSTSLERLHAWRRRSAAFRATTKHDKALAIRFADRLIGWISTPPVLLAHLSWFIVWATLNFHLLPIPEHLFKDTFGYWLFGMIPSLEQFTLIVFVLFSQNHAAQVGELRNELRLQMNITTEYELQKMLQVLTIVHHHLDIALPDEIGKPGTQTASPTPLDVAAIVKHMEHELMGKPPAASIVPASAWTSHPS